MTLRYIYAEVSGQIRAASETPKDYANIYSVYEINTDVEEQNLGYTHYIYEGQLLAKPIRPSIYHIFDYTTKTWIDPRTLEDVKTIRKQYINEERLKANQAYFVFAGKQIAADPLSRSDIDATNGYVSLMGTLPDPWAGGWKTLDNTYVAIPNVDVWKLFYSSMVTQGTTNFIHAQDLKQQIDAATTIPEVEAVTW